MWNKILCWCKLAQWQWSCTNLSQWRIWLFKFKLSNVTLNIPYIKYRWALIIQWVCIGYTENMVKCNRKWSVILCSNWLKQQHTICFLCAFPGTKRLAKQPSYEKRLGRLYCCNIDHSENRSTLKRLNTAGLYVLNVVK